MEGCVSEEVAWRVGAGSNEALVSTVSGWSGAGLVFYLHVASLYNANLLRLLLIFILSLKVLLTPPPPPKKDERQYVLMRETKLKDKTYEYNFLLCQHDEYWQ